MRFFTTFICAIVFNGELDKSIYFFESRSIVARIINNTLIQRYPMHLYIYFYESFILI